MDRSRPYHLYVVDDQPIDDRLEIGIQANDRATTHMFDQGSIHVEPGEVGTRHVHRYSGETF